MHSFITGTERGYRYREKGGREREEEEREKERLQYLPVSSKGECTGRYRVSTLLLARHVHV